MRQEDVRQRYSRRLDFGETPFAVLKAALDLCRFLLRGHQGGASRMALGLYGV